MPGAASATVLMPTLNIGMAAEMLPLAAMLAAGSYQAHDNDQATRNPEPRIIVLGVVEVPADQPLAMGLDMARSYRALLDLLPTQVEAGGRAVRVDHIVKVGRNVASAVGEAVADEGVSKLLFYWKGYAADPKGHTYGQTLDAVLADPPCDVLLVRPEGWRESHRVVLPVRGGPSAERALDLAVCIAEGLGTGLSVLHNVSPEPGAHGEEPYHLFQDYLNTIQQSASVPIETLQTEGADAAAELLMEIKGDDFAVISIPAPAPAPTPAPTPHAYAKGKPPEASTGRVPADIARAKGAPLLLLHSAEPLDLPGYIEKAHARARWEGQARGDAPSDRWFVENTYHGDEFRDPSEFLKLKQASGLTLSVALLTLNDGERIYSIITGLRRVLLEQHPLADQVAVIDAGSSDRTVEIARSLGAEVYAAEDILPLQGHLHGRGESWWKSLAVLRGDVLVWLDPRARRFHPSAALALAGPLLRSPRLQLVKAFGQSGSVDGGRKRGEGKVSSSPHVVNWGGSRVPQHGTDLAAPTSVRVQALSPDDLEGLGAGQIAALPPETILQIFCPQLNGIIAPLGRDMAGRRPLMLDMPAFIGARLEAGILVSVAEKCGVRAISQVEFQSARPAAPPEPSLRDAIDTLQALARRLSDPSMRERAGRIADRLQKEAGHSTLGGSDMAIEVRALGPVERPPMGGALREPQADGLG